MFGCVVVENTTNMSGKLDCHNIYSVNVQTLIVQYHNTYSDFTFVNNAAYADKPQLRNERGCLCLCLQKSQILPILM